MNTYLLYINYDQDFIDSFETKYLNCKIYTKLGQGVFHFPDKNTDAVEIMAMMQDHCKKEFTSPEQCFLFTISDSFNLNKLLKVF